MQTATFTVTCPATHQIVKIYSLPYESTSELEANFLESRQVWSEYIVSVAAPDCQLTASLTWHDDFCMNY